VKLQVERVPHLGRERLFALRAMRRLDLVARVPQHVDLAFEPGQTHPTPIHGRVAEVFTRTVRVHKVVYGCFDGRERGGGVATQRTLGSGGDILVFGPQVFGHGLCISELLLAHVTLVTRNGQQNVSGPVRLDVRVQRWPVRAAAYGTHGPVVLLTVGHRVAVERAIA